MMSDESMDSPVVLLSDDGTNIDMRHTASMGCGFLRDALEHITGRTIPLPFDTPTLQNIVELQELLTTNSTQECDGVLEQLSTDSRFELVNGALFLDAPALEQIICGSVAKFMCDFQTVTELRTGLSAAADLTVEEETAALAEPLFATSEPSVAAEKPLRPSRAMSSKMSEDGAERCLEHCNPETLWRLKGVSRSWQARARRVLQSVVWRTRQTVLRLEWAIGAERWSDCEAMAQALPNLTTLHAFGCEADLEALRDLQTLDSSSLRSAVKGAELPPMLLLASSLFVLATSGILQTADRHDLLGVQFPPGFVSAVAKAVGSGAPKLAALTLHRFQMPVLTLRPASMVTTLDFSYKRVTDDDMDVLSTLFGASGALPNLEKLRLDNNNIGDIGLSALATAVGNGALPLLNSLYLGDNQIGDSGLASFATALGSGALPSLTQLVLIENQIGDAGLTAFATAVGSGSLPSLKTLGLGHNMIGDAGVSALAGAMGALPSLTELYLNRNQIGDDGIAAFATAVGNGALPSLNELYLSSNQIGDTGLTALATALSNGALPLLTVLRLSQNKIGDAGITSFATALGSGALPSLETLYLDRNDIGDTGLSALAAAVGNGALARLNMLFVDDGALGTEHPKLKAACKARGITLP